MNTLNGLITRNLKAIIAAVTAGGGVVVSDLLQHAGSNVTTLTGQQWSLAVVIAALTHGATWMASNKTTLAAALNVLLPALSKSHPSVATAVRDAITAIPDYVPTAITEPVKVPVIAAPPSAYTGPIPPVTP